VPLVPAPPFHHLPPFHTQPTQEFFTIYWEKRPLHIKATPARTAFFRSLIGGTPSLLKVLEAREATEGPLAFGVEVIAARYKDGRREDLEVGGWVDGWVGGWVGGWGFRGWQGCGDTKKQLKGCVETGT
jgi:hypothetical protein